MPEDGREYRELTSAQLGVWYGQQLGPDDAVYNEGEYLEIRGDLDVELFEKALRWTANEIEAIHLRFCGEDDAPRQYIDKRNDWPCHVIDVSAALDPRAAAEEWMWADLRRPIDLRQGPLFRCAVFTAGPGRLFWYQSVHHIAIDGISV